MFLLTVLPLLCFSIFYISGNTKLIEFVFCRFQKMTEKEKQEMNKSEGGASSAKKARLSTDETQFKTKGIGHAKTCKTSTYY